MEYSKEDFLHDFFEHEALTEELGVFIKPKFITRFEEKHTKEVVFKMIQEARKENK